MPKPWGTAVAIGYHNVSIISAAKGQTVVGLERYITRSNGRNPVDGRHYAFASHDADLVSVDVFLPHGAPAIFEDPLTFCTAMERAEVTLDRKTKLPRFKKNAQFAKHVILALPAELSEAENHQLLRDWCNSEYVQHGVGVVAAYHRADDPAIDNPHVHVIASTRLVTPEGLGKKARVLNPVFTRGAGHTRATLHADDLPGRWAAFQDAWFQRNGIALRTDPFQRKGGVHHGRAKYVPGSDAAADDKAAFVESRKRAQDPAVAIEELTRRKAVFSRRDISALFRRYQFSKDEIVRLADNVLNHADLVPLYTPETGEPLKLYTSRQVRAQERDINEAAETLLLSQPNRSQKRKIATTARKLAKEMGLSKEQEGALHYLVTGPNLRILRGIAGAGKSYAIRAVREALEAGGYRVIGLAPTNTVSCAMAVDGFSQAATVDLELLRQEKGGPKATPWDKNTCLIVDEAAMVDAGRYERLLLRAAAAGARVILVGDEKQLASVERGGIFDHLKAQHGCVELLDVRRQNEDWAKTASQDFAAGRIREGLDAYATRGHLNWCDDLDTAADALCRRWGADLRRAPDANRFVYASTNKTVNRLNEALQNERWRGQQVDFRTFETSRGPIDLVIGDRIQLHGTDRKSGLFNGVVGTVTGQSESCIQFETDTGQQLSFDPQEFKDWALGYAGTAYRGQGKTQDQVYALYDHPLAWHARTGYVGFTRHKKTMDFFVPRTMAADFDALVRQMNRADQSQMSLQYLDDVEAATLQKKRAKLERQRRTGAKIVKKPNVPTPAPVFTATPFRASIGGKTISYDLAELSGRACLVRDLSTAAPGDVVAVYRALPRGSKASEAIKDARMRVASMAKGRGLSAPTGKPHLDPFNDLRDPSESLHRHPTLAPPAGGGEPDIRPFLQQSHDFSLEKARRARSILRHFDQIALKAVWDATWTAWTRAGVDERLRYPIVIGLGLLHSWLWRREERPSWLPEQTPGIYRRDYLSLFSKARREFRAFDAPANNQVQSSLPVPSPAVPPLSSSPTPISNAAETEWQIQRRQKEEKEEKRQRLQERLAYTELLLKGASGEARGALLIEQAALMSALDALDRGYDQAHGRHIPGPPATVRTSQPALSQDDMPQGPTGPLTPEKEVASDPTPPARGRTSSPTHAGKAPTGPEVEF
jgi:Ti-type conjugative transfer relaxase TraA